MTKIVFYVVVCDQIGIQISLTHQNDGQNLRFMRDINEVAKEMAKNGLKIAKSLGCAFHFESEFRFHFSVATEIIWFCLSRWVAISFCLSSYLGKKRFCHYSMLNKPLQIWVKLSLLDLMIIFDPHVTMIIFIK